MKHYLWLFMLACPVLLAETVDIHDFPKGALGILSVERLTQGSHCTVKVPVVVGRVANTGLGIDSVTGLSIIVMNQQLSDALIKGERINSNEWHFTGMAEQLSADGYIVKGIEADEGFVLNSKRRWISWLLDDKPALNCR